MVLTVEQKYALDEFWIQKLDLERRVDAAAFANLHKVRSIVNNIFLLVVRNNLGPKEVAEWQEIWSSLNICRQILGRNPTVGLCTY